VGDGEILSKLSGVREIREIKYFVFACDWDFGEGRILEKGR
jgi:hypothetical protein